MKNRCIILSLIAFALSSCSKPADRFEFQYTPDQWQDTSAFRFSMTLDEPGTSYSSRIACRLNAATIGADEIPILITVTSPAGDNFSEKIDLPITASSELIRTKRAGGPVVDIDWPYRDRIVPGQDTGIWQVAVRPIKKTMIGSIYGMGLSYKRK